MPVFNEYSSHSSYSPSFYYSPYSFSTRMSNALHSTSSTLLSTPLSAGRPISYYHPSRPVYIDTANIDVSGSQLPPLRKQNASSAVYGKIHRGRTVIRLKMSNTNDNVEIRPPLSPGRKLVEKFTIPERPKLEKSTSRVAPSGAIRRHLSINRRKPSLITEDGIPVTTSRKSSVSEEMLKEEEAIFDSLIMEEIARTNGIPEQRRKSFDCTPSNMQKGSRNNTKRYSVDVNANKNLETSESLSDFIEKLNAKIARSSSTSFSSTKPTANTSPNTTTEANKNEKLVVDREIALDEFNNKKENSYERALLKLPEKSLETSFTFTTKKPSKETEIVNKQNYIHQKVDKNTYDTLIGQFDNNKNLEKVNDEINESENPQTQMQVIQNAVVKMKVKKKSAKAVENKTNKTEQVLYNKTSEMKKYDKLSKPEEELIKEKSSKLPKTRDGINTKSEFLRSSKETITNCAFTPSKINEVQKKTALNNTLEKCVSSQTCEKEILKKTGIKTPTTKKTNKQVPKKIRTDVEKLAQKSSNTIDKERIKKSISSGELLPTKSTKKSVNDLENKMRTSKNRDAKKTDSNEETCKNTKETDNNNNQIERMKLNMDVVKTEKESKPQKEHKPINWKMIDVGRPDFEEEITDLNGLSPDEETESSEEDSSEEDSEESNGKIIYFKFR